MKLSTQILSSLTSVLASLLIGLPAIAAEQVAVELDDLELEVSITELEDFIYRNQATGELALYTSFLNLETVERAKEMLSQKYALNTEEIAPVLKAPLIQTLFTWLGEIIQTGAGTNGSQAMQTALLQAGQDDTGIDLLTIIRVFPSRTLRIDADRILVVVEQISQLREQTQEIVAIMQAVPDSTIDADLRRDLRQPGPFEVQQQALTIQDPDRQRELVVDLYRPVDPDLNQIPVVVISHGLGSGREYYQYVAEHLASYGFAVVSINHPGSDADRLLSLITGTQDTVFDLSEFAYRPLDVSFALDYLEQENATQFNGQLDTQNAGVFGNSFGGYTALAVAGAEIDRANLQQDCAKQLDSINLSLLLQCSAVDLPANSQTNFRDDRIKAALTINPVNSSIFGPVGMGKVTIPVILAASAEDIVTPALLEQVRSFTWVSSPERYLAMAEDVTHVVGESNSGGVQGLINRLVSPAPSALTNYDKFLSLAFFGTYLQGDASLRSYLQNTYAQKISEPPFNLYLVDGQLTRQFQLLLD